MEIHNPEHCQDRSHELAGVHHYANRSLLRLDGVPGMITPSSCVESSQMHQATAQTIHNHTAMFHEEVSDKMAHVAGEGMQYSMSPT